MQRKNTRTNRNYLHWILLLLILLGGATFRYFYNTGTLIDTPIRGDTAYYFGYAENLLEHATFSKDMKNDPPVPDSYWAPGYPFFLAAIIHGSLTLGIDTYKAILNAQLALGVLTILITYLIAARCLPNYWPLMPALLVALSPHLMSTGQYFLTETLTTFTLLLSILLFIRGIENRSRALLGLAGICFALSYLVNPVTLFIGPLVASLAGIKTVLPEANKKPGATKILLWTAGPLILVVVIWALRSSINVPDDSPTSSTRLVTNLVQGMHEDFHDVWRADPSNTNNPANLDLAVVAGSYSSFLQRLGEKFSEDPAGMLSWYMIKKPILLWSWDIRIGAGDIYIYPVFYSLYHTSGIALITYSVMKSMHFWLFACAVLSALFIAGNQTRPSWIAATVYISLLYISIVYCITQSAPRYSIPLRPEMYILATYFLSEVVMRYRNHKQSIIDPET